MSYARFSDESSVYVFMSTQGHLECCACRFASGGYPGSYVALSTRQMLDHLQEHIDAGHKVPEVCLTRLEQAREANDAYIQGHQRRAAVQAVFSMTGRPIPTEGRSDANS